MSIEIKSVLELTEKNGVSIAIYGESGVGKTTLALTAENPLIVTSEHKLISLRKTLIEQGRDIPCITINSSADLLPAYDYCCDSDYKTIIFDSISDIAEMLEVEIKPLHNNKQQAYGVIGERLIQIIKWFRDMPKNNVILCKEGHIAGEHGIQKYSPMLVGKMAATQFPYCMDEIFRLGYYDYQNEKHRVLFTAGDATFVAKDSSGNLDAMETPDLTKLFNKILHAA